MKLLVLGPRGQLGHDLVRAARERGHPVATLDRDALDLARPDDVPAALDRVEFDLVVNCAGHHGTDAIERDPGPAFEVNARSVGRLARVCAERGARLVHVSTDYVFSGDASSPYRETDAPGPVNVYGASKLMGEALALAAHREGTWVVRTASLFGAAAVPEGSNFIEAIARAATAGRPVRVVDDVVMSPTWTADLAAGILELLDAGVEPGIYHLVNAGQASWHELATAALDGAGMDATVEPVSSADYGATARRPPFSVLATDRAAAAGVRLRDWREALAGYLSARAALL